MLQRYPTQLMTIIFALLALLILFMRVVPFPIDDTYIYFNYARNFVDGRPFAYDIRGIPSEGFTSLLYLLMLVPFKAVGLEMIFTSALLNILGIFLTAVLAAHLAARISGKHPAALFFITFITLYLFDFNIVGIINLGLETAFVPVMLFAAAWTIVHATDSQAVHRSRYVTLFYGVTFLAFLVRPENLFLIGGIGGLFLLIYYPNRREVVLKAVIFALVLAAYHGFKLVVFQDVMPTGFYRKVTLGPDGAEYVTMAVIRYSPSWLLLIILLFIQRRKIGSVFRQPAALFLVFVTVATLIFFMQVYPLTGYYYRFLMNATASLTFFVSLWIVQLIGQSRKTYALAGTLLVLPLVFAQIPLAEIFTRLNLYQRTVEANQQQPYIQFATFLRERLPQHKDMTMVFGDAGIFPYAFQSRFIDANGLSEPYIAHLFRLPDGAEKTRLYNEYILSWNPDIIILGFGPVEEGLWKAPVNRHSPFRQPQPPESFAGFRDYGIRYVCSVKAGYDIHLGVWQDSPYFDAIVTTLLEYCETEGYLLPDGFTVETQGQQIKFPGL